MATFASIIAEQLKKDDPLTVLHELAGYLDDKNTLLITPDTYEDACERRININPRKENVFLRGLIDGVKELPIKSNPYHLHSAVPDLLKTYKVAHKMGRTFSFLVNGEEEDKPDLAKVPEHLKNHLPAYANKVIQCINYGVHLMDCDEDGFCVHCGHQEDLDDILQEAEKHLEVSNYASFLAASSGGAFSHDYYMRKAQEQYDQDHSGE